MKRIDKVTQRKLYWLFIPMAMVVVWEMAYLWFGMNLLETWFGVEVDVLAWCQPALLGALLIVFVGYAVAAIRQKCWGELAIALIIVTVTLLNMSNFFVELLLQ